MLAELPHYPEAGEMVDRIGQLYAIEAESKRSSPEERLATLAALRAKQAPGGIRTPDPQAYLAPVA